jgi:Protein of unknown function (DUF2865)
MPLFEPRRFVWRSSKKRNPFEIAAALVLLGVLALPTVVGNESALDAPSMSAQSLYLGNSFSLADAVSGTYSRSRETRRKRNVARSKAAGRKKTRGKGSVKTVSRKSVRVAAPRVFRTMCVRLCDGFYFPISFAASADEFERDEEICQSRCSSPAKLFVYPNTQGTPDDMVDLEGRPYDMLTTARQFKVAYDPSCGCKPAPWSQEARNQHWSYAVAAARETKGRPARMEVAAAATPVPDDIRSARKTVSSVKVASVAVDAHTKNDAVNVTKDALASARKPEASTTNTTKKDPRPKAVTVSAQKKKVVSRTKRVRSARSAAAKRKAQRRKAAGASRKVRRRVVKRRNVQRVAQTRRSHVRSSARYRRPQPRGLF